MIHRVRAIEEFEGDILAELRAPNGDTYVEKWCAYESSSVRTLIVKTTKEAIAEYETGRLSMLDLLVESNDDSGFLVDWSRGARTTFSAVQVSTINPLYLPDASAMYDSSLRPREV
jgi:hypothetical protein